MLYFDSNKYTRQGFILGRKERLTYLPTSAIQIPGRTPKFPWTLAHFPRDPNKFSSLAELPWYIIYMKYTKSNCMPSNCQPMPVKSRDKVQNLLYCNGKSY